MEGIHTVAGTGRVKVASSFWMLVIAGTIPGIDNANATNIMVSLLLAIQESIKWISLSSTGIRPL